ncbi:MAG TPA: bifunctional nuclease family protein [Roseiflexaceae bacterium]|nr:bifunctional nuclease family protein [Roseiflexaceae bacterium]HMP39391.1 bifunctional nuclease family protein [Roseiflexaceae bacterium]
MIRVTVDSIRVSLLTQHRVVVLREADSRRYLPIWIGAFEADAIALALQGHESQRPMTHDLLKSVFAELGGTIHHILVNDIQDSTFFARIIVEQGGRTFEIDARPSDAIALAVRSDVPIFVEPHVFEQVGVLFDEDEAAATLEEPPAATTAEEPATPAEPATEEDLSLFRDFINTLDIDDDENRKDKSS